MGHEDFIEVDLYEDGRWVTRRLPLEVAEYLYQRLGLALVGHERPQSQAVEADRLKLLVD